MLITPQDGGWQPLAPSALPHLPQEAPPTAMTLADIEQVKKDFIYTAQQAQAMGIEALELHAAHGYLMHQFLSPLANQRSDAYGGSFENRIRFVMEVFADVRQVFKGALGIRISGTDWVEGGWSVDDAVRLAGVAGQAGVETRLDVFPEMQHVFQIAVGRQKHDRDFAGTRIVAQPIDELNSVDSGQYVVDNDQRRQLIV